MKLADFNRLKKFMMLTTSDNESEALAALRQANSLLSRQSPPLTWDRVLDRSVKVLGYDDGDNSERVNPDAGNPHRHGSRPPSQILDQAFAELEGVEFDSQSFTDLVESIRAQYENGKALSARQREIIISAAAREGERRSGRGRR